VPNWIWISWIFVFGSCVGSFLNVVIYRLPRNKSLVLPPSACPGCGKNIAFYDNIPLISWLILRAKCRYCKAAISPRYFLIELLTGSVFTALFILYFHTGLRSGIGSFVDGGWFIYLLSIILLAALIAVSAIDLELWVIPISVCWFVTGVGLISSAVGGFVIEPVTIARNVLLPVASAKTASLAVGAGIGLIISLILLWAGVFKRSYESGSEDAEVELGKPGGGEDSFDHRGEICKEVLFLLPVVICSPLAYWVLTKYSWWVNFTQVPVISGLLGSLWGYFVGCTVVWATRILGTLGFGREAMGLGDVHLMGAAGAVIGPVFVVIAFFIAPFFGLGWALFQMFFKKVRQIPYGPFLSMGIFSVMILQDWILKFIIGVYYR